MWVALLGALAIYSVALAKAWHHRRALVKLLNPLNENPFEATITTEIEIISSLAHQNTDTMVRATRVDSGEIFDGSQMLDFLNGKGPYSVQVRGLQIEGGGQGRSRSEMLYIPTLTRKAALAEENQEAWLYARVAFLYFLVMMLCWIPASVNRLVSFINPDNVIFGLNFTAILFLPLQGFLNALVYCVSSQTAVRSLFKSEDGRDGSRKDSARIPSTTPSSDAFVIPRDVGRLQDNNVEMLHTINNYEIRPPRPRTENLDFGFDK